MARYTQLVVLCEDRQQEVFARRFLVCCGIDPHRIYYKTSRQGRGSGEQYVREQYPVEVKAYRSKCHHLSIGLAVITDADTRTVARRQDELKRSLAAASLQDRESGERIGVFVPKRNIETWIRYLQGMSVNEEDDYSHFDRVGEDWKDAVESLAARRGDPLPPDAPPSLQAACGELDRIL